VPEPFFDDDGQHIGWVVEADDGETYLTELDGEIAAVWDDAEQGWDLDGAEGIELDFGEPDDQLAAFDARLDRIEQIAAEPRTVTFEAAPAPPDPEAIVEGWHTDQRDLERALGYRFSVSQNRAIVSHAADSGLSFIDAAADLAERGRGVLPDLDEGTRLERHQARVAQMTERAMDVDPATPPEDLVTGEPLPQADLYDMDDREQRHAYYADRLRGATDADAAYSSSDESEGW
jgi:hypothetical protein